MIRFFTIGVFIPFLINITLFVKGQIPPGYYDDATGLSGSALKAALNNIIDGHTSISYADVVDALKVLDEDPNNFSNVILLYKTTSIAKSSFGGNPDEWNREHVWPGSHGGFGTSAPAGTDLHHLKPTDVSVNSDRGDKDFDNCQATGTQHSEATLCYFTTDAWEPPDAVKGDIARMVFYMVVRYEGENGEPELELSDSYTSSSGSPAYLGIETTLKQWHQNDPVDADEQARNNSIYYDYQNNRNPFIDHPEYVNLIWGGGLADEPSKHVNDFSAHNIILNWTDATGTVLPDGYLVRMSATSFENIITPTDGVAVADNLLNQNVTYGAETCAFTNLNTNTTYYFKIFGYTGSGVNIDYKTDGDVMQASISTVNLFLLNIN